MVCWLAGFNSRSSDLGTSPSQIVMLCSHPTLPRTKNEKTWKKKSWGGGVGVGVVNCDEFSSHPRGVDKLVHGPLKAFKLHLSPLT